MDEVRRQFILSDVARSVERRGWAELSSELADEISLTARERKQFAYKHNCEIQPNRSGGLVFTRASQN